MLLQTVDSICGHDFFFIAEYIFRVPHNKNVFTLRKIKSNDSTQFWALKSCGEVDVNRLMNYSSVFNVQIFDCCKCFIRKVTLNCFETIFDAICHSDGYSHRTNKKKTNHSIILPIENNLLFENACVRMSFKLISRFACLIIDII